MFRKIYTLLILFTILTPVLYALGGGGGDTETIPLPSKDFIAEFTDRNNVKTSADKVSWEGKIFIEAKMGSYSVTIPFEKIKMVEIDSNTIDKDGNIPAVIETSDEKINVKTNGNKKIYGETAYGTFQIFVKDLRKIEFNHNR